MIKLFNTLITRRMLFGILCLSAMLYKPEIATPITILYSLIIGCAITDSLTMRSSTSKDKGEQE